MEAGGAQGFSFWGPGLGSEAASLDARAESLGEVRLALDYPLSVPPDPASLSRTGPIAQPHRSAEVATELEAAKLCEPRVANADPP